MSVLRIVSAVSGPGVTITIADTPRNAASCAAMRRSGSDDHVGKTSGMRSRLSRALAATALAPLIAHAVALQRDGKIVVAGEAVCDLAGCFGLVRYNRDGSLDRSFGNDGIVLTKFPPLNGAIAFDVAVQPDGKIVAVGKRYRGGDAQNDDLWALARYLPNGRLDTSFSGDGRTSIDFGY